MVSPNQRICGVARDISLKSLSVGTLTQRERGILAEIVVGHSSKEIARFLEISPRTVEFHRANLLKKVAAKNTADLVRKVSG
jgi:DNA-binding CsgD family transcriptional regulator